MKHLILLMMITLFSNTSVAAKIYKCTNSKGETEFKNMPCSGKQKGGTIEVHAGSASNEMPWYKKTSRGSSYTTTDNSPSISGRNSRYTGLTSGTSSRDGNRYNNNYKERRKETDDKICKIYTDSLKSAEEKWEYKRRHGYNSSEKERHEQTIRDRKRAVDRNCK